MFLVVCTSCFDCGNQQSIGLFENKPSDEAVKQLKNILGGMWCINVRIYTDVKV